MTLIDDVRDAIARDGHASEEMLRRIEEELLVRPSAELWILRGDAIQLMDALTYSLEEAEASYRKAAELAPTSPAPYESLGWFTYAVMDDARGSLEFFRKAVELGAGESALEGLHGVQEEIRNFDS